MQQYGEEQDYDEYSSSADSPHELLRDILMHLIQEEKHKVFGEEDWF